MNQAATILLVEDNPSLLNGICDLLEINDLGYDLRVLTAGNGRDGLAIMAETAPDLIISDIMMPQMDGFQFLKHVRQRQEWLHIPFIFLTAKGKEKDIIEGRLSGAELYITKPFNSTELIELAQTQLNRAFTLQKARQEDMDGLKQNILQIINHEFRTPLTYVTAYYEMLESSVANAEDEEDLEMYLQGIQAGCVRLSQLIEDLIAIVELRSGEGLARFQARARHISDIGPRFRRVVEARKADTMEAGIKLQMHIPERAGPIFGDPEALEDVVARLVDNAIKFTRAKRDGEKAVHVALETAPDEVRLTVTDTGIGFPARVNGQIFEPFFQFNRSHFEQQGSGSGLTIARAVVEMHGGRLEGKGVEDQGSRFTMTLPVSAGWQRPLRASATPGVASRQATILVVEDDKFLLDGLREILELDERAYRFTVYTAGNGLRALKVLEEVRPDLIISDIMMPQMGGYELLNKVRQNPDWVKIPFIFLTARGERDERHKGLRSGVAEYIAKPYDSDYLVDMIVTLLDRHFEVEGVADQGFDELKQSILALLQPEFRQPLDVVNTHSERLVAELQEAEDDAQLSDSLRRIQVSSRHLTQLVEDFITLAEIRTGQLGRGQRNVPVLLKEPASLLMEAKLAYEMKATASALSVRQEPSMLTQSVKCLLTHVVDALKRLIELAGKLGVVQRKEPGGEIVLRTAESQTEVYFEVTFEGAALRADFAAQVATFLDASHGAVLDTPEFGIPLTIVAEIARFHNGQLLLQTGSSSFTFTFMLPAA